MHYLGALLEEQLVWIRITTLQFVLFDQFLSNQLSSRLEVALFCRATIFFKNVVQKKNLVVKAVLEHFLVLVEALVSPIFLLNLIDYVIDHHADSNELWRRNWILYNVSLKIRFWLINLCLNMKIRLFIKNRLVLLYELFKHTFLLFMIFEFFFVN